MHVLQSILLFLGFIILLLIGVMSVFHDLIARDWHLVEIHFDDADSIDQDQPLTMQAERSYVEHNSR